MAADPTTSEEQLGKSLAGFDKPLRIAVEVCATRCCTSLRRCYRIQIGKISTFARPATELCAALIPRWQAAGRRPPGVHHQIPLQSVFHPHVGGQGHSGQDFSSVRWWALPLSKKREKRPVGDAVQLARFAAMSAISASSLAVGSGITLQSAK